MLFAPGGLNLDHSGPTPFGGSGGELLPPVLSIRNGGESGLPVFRTAITEFSHRVACGLRAFSRFSTTIASASDLNVV